MGLKLYKFVGGEADGRELEIDEKYTRIMYETTPPEAITVSPSPSMGEPSREFYVKSKIRVSTFPDCIETEEYFKLVSLSDTEAITMLLKGYNPERRG